MVSPANSKGVKKANMALARLCVYRNSSSHRLFIPSHIDFILWLKRGRVSLDWQFPEEQLSRSKLVAGKKSDEVAPSELRAFDAGSATAEAHRRRCICSLSGRSTDCSVVKPRET